MKVRLLLIAKLTKSIIKMAKLNAGESIFRQSQTMGLKLMPLLSDA